jgi:membrane-bound ClpP family serine protease
MESTPAMTAIRHLQVGDKGCTLSALRPYGSVQFGDHRIEAMIEGSYLQSGRAVRLREIQESRIVVEEIEADVKTDSGVDTLPA